MKTLVLIAAALSAAALAGCATPGKECERVRDVGVRVEDDSYVVVDRDPIVVCAKDKWIRWVLPSTQPYLFTADGVVIEDNHSEFTNCTKGNLGQRDPSGLSFRCHDKNDKHGEPDPRYYRYKITVEKKGSTPIRVDPSIMNH